MLSSHIPHLRYLWLVCASLIAGVMNAMAGGGSFVSFPAMLGMGVPPIQANATNTVALWPGQLTSLATLRGDVRRDLLPPVVITSVLGGVTGAEILLHTTQHTFFRLIPWLILIGTLIFAASGPVSKWLRERARHPQIERPISPLLLSVALFPVSVYIGYFGAGGGIVAMTVLALFGVEEMHKLNAMKLVTASLSNFVAVVTFIAAGFVLWRYCLVSMVFAGLGGYIGAKWTKRTDPEVLRAIVVATGCAISAYFFWKQAHA
ncbi:MAG: sulfite exporter TauE/SafE family protein [Acidobacteriota bacterium]|nr:sulfite exporter TauE/SafE family protein [Acidobacteriota bacterium]